MSVCAPLNHYILAMFVPMCQFSFLFANHSIHLKRFEKSENWEQLSRLGYLVCYSLNAFLQLTYLTIQIDQPCGIYRLNTFISDTVIPDVMKSWRAFVRIYHKNLEYYKNKHYILYNNSVAVSFVIAESQWTLWELWNSCRFESTKLHSYALRLLFVVFF